MVIQHLESSNQHQRSAKKLLRRPDATTQSTGLVWHLLSRLKQKSRITPLHRIQKRWHRLQTPCSRLQWSTASQRLPPI